MHRSFIVLFIAALAALAAPVAIAQAQTNDQAAGGQEAAAQDTKPAGQETADGAVAPAAQPAAASCDGMIDPAELTDACDAKLRDDAEWRVGLGTELGSRIMCAVKTRKGRKANSNDACAEVKIEPWLSELAEQLNHEVHQQELEAIQQNNRHVILAYSALWIFMIGFVAFMWNRQRQLKNEIDHLQSELAQATEDDA